jgi:XisH protein
MAKDLFHEAAKQALINDGWLITHDPYELPLFGKMLKVDLGAERLIAAQKEAELIAVEVKSFLGSSAIYDYHLALGQYLHYAFAMRSKEPQRVVFLAIPKEIYLSFFDQDDVMASLVEYKVNLIVFDDFALSVYKTIKNT